ncbi:hypothetical protein DFH27DRAFT_657088 [Peziza echinospora]|nr:hypothetical protein DFH27DRAFT_657088 [Peziza echinospora]
MSNPNGNGPPPSNNETTSNNAHGNPEEEEEEAASSRSITPYTTTLASAIPQQGPSVSRKRNKKPIDIIIYKSGIFLHFTTAVTYATLVREFEPLPTGHLHPLSPLLSIRPPTARRLRITLLGICRKSILKFFSSSAAPTAPLPIEEYVMAAIVDSERSWEAFLTLCLWRLEENGIEEGSRAIGLSMRSET